MTGNEALDGSPPMPGDASVDRDLSIDRRQPGFMEHLTRNRRRCSHEWDRGHRMNRRALVRYRFDQNIDVDVAPLLTLSLPWALSRQCICSPFTPLPATGSAVRLRDAGGPLALSPPAYARHGQWFAQLGNWTADRARTPPGRHTREPFKPRDLVV